METVSYQNDSKSAMMRAKPPTPMSSGRPTGTAAEGGVAMEGGQCHTPPPSDKENQLSGAVVCTYMCACVCVSVHVTLSGHFGIQYVASRVHTLGSIYSYSVCLLSSSPHTH